MPAQLKSEALLGYANPHSPCPFLHSSNSWSAWQIGAWLAATGRSSPRDVRPSRGYSYHVNDMKVQFHYEGGRDWHLERIA